jgi:hypothetical protein
MRGQPETVSALTTASTDDVLAVLFVEADSANVGEIMRRMLSCFTGPAVAVFDPVARRIIGTDDETTAAAILAVWNADAQWNPGSRFTPRAGEFGVLMKWQAVNDDTLNLGPLLGNEIQRRSFYGVVNSGLGVWGNSTPAQNEPCCLVDQSAAEIAFKFADLSALYAIQPDGNTVTVQFAQPRTKNAFE